jgi:hypothetical protein
VRNTARPCARVAHLSRRPSRDSLIELRIDPQAITTQTTLDALRAKALKR